MTDDVRQLTCFDSCRHPTEVLLSRVVIARLAAWHTVVQAIFAKPNIQLALANGAVLFALAFLFAHVAL